MQNSMITDLGAIITIIIIIIILIIINLFKKAARGTNTTEQVNLMGGLIGYLEVRTVIKPPNLDISSIQHYSADQPDTHAL